MKLWNKKQYRKINSFDWLKYIWMKEEYLTEIIHLNSKYEKMIC